MGAERKHACSICGRQVAARPANGAFPFCSPACKLVDLGKWLDGAYRIPGPPAEFDTEGADLRSADEEDE